MKSKSIIITLLFLFVFLIGIIVGQFLKVGSVGAAEQLTGKETQTPQQALQQVQVANIIGDLTTLKKAVILNYYQLQKNFALLNKMEKVQLLIAEDAKINYKLLQPIQDDFSRRNIEIDFEMKKLQ